MATRSEPFGSIDELLALLRADLSPAAFFATNTRGSDGRWHAMHGDAGAGVLYRLVIPENVFAPPFKGFEWIGRQALPRPGGQRIADKFDGGRTLFPLPATVRRSAGESRGWRPPCYRRQRRINVACEVRFLVRHFQCVFRDLAPHPVGVVPGPG